MNHSRLKPYRLGELLVDKGIITPRQLKRALYFQSANKQTLGESLQALGYVSKHQVTITLWRQKWLRIIASVLMVMAPATSAFAVEPAPSNHWNSFKKVLDKFSFDRGETTDNQYSLGVKYHFSSSSSLTFGVEQQPNIGYGVRWTPEIALTRFDQSIKPNPSHYYAHSRFNSDSSNRYKNSTPIHYRVSIKGYSMFENSGDQNRYFNFDRQQDDVASKFQLMFSFTKRFD